MKPITGPAQVAPSPDTSPTTDRDAPQQRLLPGLLAAVRNYRSVPPERALFRELVAQVLRDITTVTVGGYEISASTIAGVAWALHGRMNAAGLVVDVNGRPIARSTIAADARLNLRAVVAALHFLKGQYMIVITPGRGRLRATIAINLGGLDWPAIRERVKLAIADRHAAAAAAAPADPQQPLPLRSACGVAPTSQGARSGVAPTRHEGYVRGVHRPADPIAAADSPARTRTREAEADRKQQQQQQDQIRIDGLFPAIAARCRELGLKYDEASERQDLAAGLINLADLQAHADQLEEQRRERRRPRL